MTIQQIRLGHANNSSSSHSIIVLDTPRPEFAPSGRLTKITSLENLRWGRQDFYLKTQDAKICYLVSQFIEAVRNITNSETIALNTVASMFYGLIDQNEWHAILTEIKKENYSTWVDHQSAWNLPQSKGFINEEFFKETIQYILRPDINILGGSDESERLTPHYAGNEIRFPFSDSCGIVRAKKFAQNWVLYNSRNGTRIVFSFEKNPPPLTHVEIPLLVDLKLTDYCPFGCPFCYQGSTKDGKHADTDYIDGVFYKLDELGTFEVALGGGSAELHPDFWRILHQKTEFTVNLTTKNFAWLEKNVEKLGRFGSIAVSISSEEDLSKLKELVRKLAGLNGPRLSAQTIPQVVGKEFLKKIVREVTWDFDLTLLGYKRVGFGESFENQIHPFFDWMEVCKDRLAKVSIDTALVRQSKDILKDIPKEMYFDTEGTFSCYIDGVGKYLAKSSFDAEGKKYPMKNAFKLLERFAEMQKEEGIRQ